MSVLSVFNQTVTELLPSRKSAPTEADRAGDFGRELKDADARLDRSQPADDQPKTKSEAEKPKATAEATTKTDKPDAPRETKQTTRKDDAPDDTTDVSDQAVVTDDTLVDTAQPVQADTTQAASEAVTTAASDNQLVEQVLVPVTGEATSQADQTVTNTGTISSQATEQAAANNSAVAATQAATEQAAPIPGAVQPQQDKAAQTQQAATANQNEPSATAQRIAIVSEARQETDKRSSGEDAGQQHGALKGNAGQQVATQTTHAQAASFTAVTAPADAASAGAQAFTAVDTANPATTTTAVAQPGPVAQTQDTDNTQLNTARIARGLQNAVHQKGGAVTLRLTPPEMGTVRIQLQIQNGTVNAQFHAETESTRTMLNQQLSHLRTALENQGLSVDRLGVQTMQNSSGSNLQNESESGRDGQANDGRSRGGFTHQGNRQGQPSDTPEQQAFEQELTHAA
ncbi:MAG: flagellar hook-length control protein FliK [Phycisphaerales bacterium]